MKFKKIIGTALALVVWSTGAQAFEYTSRVVELGEDRSAVPRWCEATIEAGDTHGYWPYAQSFHGAINLGDIEAFSVARIVKSISTLSGIPNEAAARRLQVGQKLWLPCMDNDPAVIRSRMVESGDAEIVIDPAAAQAAIDAIGVVVEGGHAANQATIDQFQLMLKAIEGRLNDPNLGLDATTLDPLQQLASTVRAHMDETSALIAQGADAMRVTAVDRRLSSISYELADLSARFYAAEQVGALGTVVTAVAADVDRINGLVTKLPTEARVREIISAEGSQQTWQAYFGLAGVLMLLAFLAFRRWIEPNFGVSKEAAKTEAKAVAKAAMAEVTDPSRPGSLAAKVVTLAGEVANQREALDDVADVVYTDRFAVTNGMLEAVNDLADGESIKLPAKPLGTGANAEGFTVKAEAQSDGSLAFVVVELPEGGENLWHKGNGFTKKQIGAAGSRFVNFKFAERAAAKVAPAAAAAD